MPVNEVSTAQSGMLLMSLISCCAIRVPWLSKSDTEVAVHTNASFSA